MLPRITHSKFLQTTIVAATVGMMLFCSHSLCAQELNASNGAAFDDFGFSVSLSGNSGLVGARLDDDSGGNSGSAYLFRGLNTATGTINESVKLLASDGAAGDEFGFSVSLSGNTGLVGARNDDDNGFLSGSAYVFRGLDSATGTINESVKLLASDGVSGDQFGISVSLSGNTGLVGASLDDDNGDFSGSAYVFRGLDSATGTINESVKLLASDGAAFDQFGRSISLSGNTGLVGASLDDDNGNGSGSAYLFRGLDTATGMINESAKLIASDGAAGDQFGTSVSLSGNTGLVGASLDDDNGNGSGSAYLFRGLDTATGTINESAILLASDGTTDDQFGTSVSLSGNTGLIGAIGDDDSGSVSGSAYVFRGLDTATGTVNESVKLLASDGAAGDQFGASVSLDGDRLTIGSLFGDGISANTGSAYTGTVSSVTTLDFGNTSAIIDGISFESRTDWIIGETTSDNHVELTLGDSAEILESGTRILIGANAGSNDNSLTISGSLTAITGEIGAVGSFGNQLILNSTATTAIDTLTLHGNNSLLIEGDFTTFASLDAQLGATDLFAFVDGSSQLVTDLNFDTLLRTNFDGTTGFTTFTAVPEPTCATVLLCALALGAVRRRRTF